MESNAGEREGIVCNFEKIIERSWRYEHRDCLSTKTKTCALWNEKRKRLLIGDESIEYQKDKFNNKLIVDSLIIGKHFPLLPSRVGQANSCQKRRSQRQKWKMILNNYCTLNFYTKKRWQVVNLYFAYNQLLKSSFFVRKKSRA